MIKGEADKKTGMVLEEGGTEEKKREEKERKTKLSERKKGHSTGIIFFRKESEEKGK